MSYYDSEIDEQGTRDEEDPYSDLPWLNRDEYSFRGPERMKPEIKARWLAALRSGEYQQGRGELASTDGEFCCLGVLCEVAAQDGVVHRVERRGFYGDVEGIQYETVDNPAATPGTGVLPLSVVEWAGLNNENPDVMNDKEQIACVASLNDRGYSFEQIADLIESNL